jgi:uncharacterized protein (DUF2062 family)
MIPIIIFGSFKLGGLFIESNKLNIIYDKGLSLDLIKDNIVQYLIGSLVLGVTLAIFVGICTYTSLLFFRKKAEIKEEYIKPYQD